MAEQGWRGSWLVTAALLAVVPHALRAQQSGPAPEAVWALDTLRSGFCINFLVDPAIAAQRTFRGVTPVPASSAESLHPALRVVVESSLLDPAVLVDTPGVGSVFTHNTDEANDSKFAASSKPL